MTCKQTGNMKTSIRSTCVSVEVVALQAKSAVVRGGVAATDHLQKQQYTTR
jgi:hypothetical protein